MIRAILKFYTMLLTIDAILSFFPELDKQQWRQKLKKMCDFSCAPLRRFLPPGLVAIGSFDFSPIIAIFLIYIFIEVFTYLW